MSYRDILRSADEHFAATVKDQPRNLNCRLGCTLCCYGLFQIAEADLAMIANGVEQLEPDTRAAMVERAERMMRDTAHPDLREASESEKEAFFHRTAELPCPALGPEGQCLIYEHRPLVCRTFGLPIRDGATYLGEECELNFTSASQSEKERAAWDLQREDEVGPEDQFTVAEAIVLVARLRTS